MNTPNKLDNKQLANVLHALSIMGEMPNFKRLSQHTNKSPEQIKSLWLINNETRK